MIRRLLRPILKLFFNPNPLIQALHIQSQLNTLNAEREAAAARLDQLHYEVMHNLVVETTRIGIEVKNLKMRVESLTSRLEFNERRARALESVVVVPAGRRAGRRRDRPRAAPRSSRAPASQTGRRRRAGRRRGAGPASRRSSRRRRPGPAQPAPPAPPRRGAAAAPAAAIMGGPGDRPTPAGVGLDAGASRRTGAPTSRRRRDPTRRPTAGSVRDRAPADAGPDDEQ